MLNIAPMEIIIEVNVAVQSVTVKSSKMFQREGLYFIYVLTIVFK